jgi:phage tail-like protein
MVTGNPRHFHKKFKFIVEIDSVRYAGFQKCSDLSVEIAMVEYFEGGTLIPNKSPGRLKFPDVTLERGATQDIDLFNWFQQVADAAANAGKGSGLNEPAFKRNLDVVQQDRDGSELRRWRLNGAWPTKFMAGTWDNGSDENVIESVSLAYDFFQLKQK